MSEIDYDSKIIEMNNKLKNKFKLLVEKEKQEEEIIIEHKKRKLEQFEEKRRQKELLVINTLKKLIIDEIDIYTCSDDNKIIKNNGLIENDIVKLFGINSVVNNDVVNGFSFGNTCSKITANTSNSFGIPVINDNVKKENIEKNAYFTLNNDVVNGFSFGNTCSKITANTSNSFGIPVINDNVKKENIEKNAYFTLNNDDIKTLIFPNTYGEVIGNDIINAFKRNKNLIEIICDYFLFDKSFNEKSVKFSYITKIIRTNSNENSYKLFIYVKGTSEIDMFGCKVLSFGAV